MDILIKKNNKKKENIEKLAEAIDVENVESLTPETEFRELDEWSSLAALSLIAMFDEEYNVTVNGTAIREAETIEDLYNLTK